MSARLVVFRCLLLALCGSSVATPVARAQFLGGPLRTEFELSEGVQLDRADHTVLANLERVKAFLADQHWNEAVETLRQVMEESGSQLMGVTPQRYVTVRDYCHFRLANLPPEALALYRRRADPLAQKWYEEGLHTLSADLIRSVVERAFASSWGDRALLALGELSLSAGDAVKARWYWQRILPVEPALAETWPAYPDSKIDPAQVRARIVLASILEGAERRARDELAQFERLHPSARGILGGQEVNYAQALHALLEESAAWPTPPRSPDWPTFAGAPERNKIQPGAADVSGVAWRIPLARPIVARRMRSPSTTPRVADDPRAALVYYPVIVGDRVFACNTQQVLAADVHSGQPAWPGARLVIHETAASEAADITDPPEGLGSARYTLTISHQRLLARLGSAVTSQPQSPNLHIHPGHLVCLDLSAQGRLLWKLEAEPGWAFEGAPLADATTIYVAQRRSDVRPQAHVAAYDAQTGRLRWRRYVCAAETPARSLYHEATSNLLTLADDTLYFNSNLGAVAALAAADGQIRWLTLYPRARRGDVSRLAPHWQRELTPCLYHRGLLLVAPADSPRILAFDACSGQLLWQTGSEVEDSIHLLGVVDEHLIASGHRVYWIGLAEGVQGRVRRLWPESVEKLGFGRGLLADGVVYWPARNKIYRLDAKKGQPLGEIDLTRWGLRGGNLLLADRQLLIATPTELVALGKPPAQTPAPPQPLTFHFSQE